jgi:hypothetical protein
MFNIIMNEPVLIISGSTIRLYILNSNKDYTYTIINDGK